MSDSTPREWRFYVDDMIDCAEKVIAYPQIPWRQVVATRNRLIHGYLGIDNDTLWSIVEQDTPALLTQLAALKRQLG
jgi:uncharacterized protein with HEPN domain